MPLSVPEKVAQQLAFRLQEELQTLNVMPQVYENQTRRAHTCRLKHFQSKQQPSGHITVMYAALGTYG